MCNVGWLKTTFTFATWRGNKNFARVDMLLFLLIFCDFAKGDIVESPVDSDALQSALAVMHCRSNAVQQFPIQWHHLPIDSDSELVYDDNHFYSRYKEGFQIVGNRSGEFNLKLNHVGLQDAGLYTCSEASTGATKGAQLIVLESYPSEKSCSTSQPLDGAIGFKCGNLTPETINLSCNLSYRGNYRAVLEWVDDQSNVYASTTSTSGNVTNYSITLKADELRKNSNKFSCRIKYKESELNSAFSWSTTVHVLKNDTKNYTASCKDSTKVVVNCTISTSHHQCSYSWRQSSKDGSPQKVIHEGPILNVSVLPNEGFYTCTATCVIRGNTCNLVPTTLSYSCPSQGEDGNDITTPLTYAVMGIVITAFMLVLICVLLIHYKKRSRYRPCSCSSSNSL